MAKLINCGKRPAKSDRRSPIVRRVFRIAQRLFWACNGMEIRDCHFVEWSEGKVWMKRFDKPLIRIEIVDPPAGRCRHCGMKQ